jgi:hypothetical protein
MKINLIIDGNYLLQKSVFVLFKLRSLYKDLPVILNKDFNILTNLYFFNKIYFISDSKTNWRKSIFVEYKGKRKKNENINWNEVYEIFDNFKNSIVKENYNFYQIDNLEGDDIISYVVNETNKKGESNLIIANDSDLFQLVNYDMVNKYINFMYNFKFNDERVYLPCLYNEYIDNIDNGDIFDDLFGGSGDDTVEFLEFIKGLINTKKVIEIDSEKELFIKISGHNKDGIKSVYMKGNRGIGKIGSEKMYNLYKETYPDIIDFNSDDFKNRLIDIIKYYKKINDNDMDNELRSRLNLNLKLVKLDKRSIPKKLYERMKNEINI